MKVTAVKTHKITQKDKDLFKILDKYLSAGRQGLPKLKDKSVVAITSKIVSITEGRMVPIGKVSNVSKVPSVSKGEKDLKDRLIEQESQYYLPRSENKYGVSLTITNNTLVATAGIDESNGNGYYVLWPKDAQKTANAIRSHLASRFNLKKIGVVITDSKTTPLRWGVTAFAIAYSGVEPLKNYIGVKDLFGRAFQFEKLNIADCLASAAALVMGEGSEQTPIAIIEDIPFVQFKVANPSKAELKNLRISKEEDLYSPLLKNAPWRKGKK